MRVVIFILFCMYCSITHAETSQIQNKVKFLELQYKNKTILDFAMRRKADGLEIPQYLDTFYKQKDFQEKLKLYNDKKNPIIDDPFDLRLLVLGDDFYTNGNPTVTDPSSQIEALLASIKKKSKLNGYESKIKSNWYGSSQIPYYSAVAMIVGKNGIKNNFDGSFSLNLQNFLASTGVNSLPLCPNKNEFKDKTHVKDAYCTGFLSEHNGKQKFFTAKHCLENKKDGQSLLDSYVVFGYQIDSKGYFFNRLSASYLYKFSKILDDGDSASEAAYSDKNKDYAILELNKFVPSEIAKPLELNLTEVRELNQHVVLVGYPQGLSQKVDFSIEHQEPLIEKIEGNILSVSTDSHHSNSGSPIISSKSGEVIGIMLSGLPDYNTCYEEGVFCACSNSGEPKNTKEKAIDLKAIKYLTKIH